MQSGKHYDMARKKIERKWASDLFDILSGSPTKPPVGPVPAPTPVTSDVIKAIEAKASKIAYDVNVNLITSAKDKQQAEAILLQLESVFAQFNSANLNNIQSSRLNSDRALKKMFYAFSFRLFDSGRAMVLSTEELASLYHFPTTEIETPKVKFVRAKQAAPPPVIPTEGIVLGENVFRGVETTVRMKTDDRRRHLYVVGQTGTGKTSLMKNLIAQDIKNGEGVGIIDPHGEFADYALGCVPPERVEDVVYLNPADLERPIGLNMLEYDPKYPEQKTFIVNELISIFDKLYDLKATGGPLFEQYTRNALLLLMDDPAEGATLMEVPRVMADAAFRQRLLAKCRNIVVKDFWEKEAEKAGGEAALQNLVPYVTSKFNTFIANDFMRPIIGQSRSSLNFREIMDKKKILVVNLSKGRLGDINAYLLGLIIVGKLTMASFARIDTPEELRPDFFLYIDEFQNFITDSIATILSEARKYRLCLTLAHQFIKQLPEKIRDAVFGNVGSLVSFRVSAEDSEQLAKHFVPVFDQNDLINLDNFTAYAKLLINNLTVKPFNLVFKKPAAASEETIAALKELTRLKYGRERALVEQEIAQRYQIQTTTQ
jgi:GTPase SAR1 family protein